MIFDENLDSVIRELIKAAHIESKVHSLPQTVGDIGDCIKSKILTPLVRWMRGESVVVGPRVVILDDRKKPGTKNFFRHIWQHGLGFLYKIMINRAHKKIYAPGLYSINGRQSLA